MSKYDYQDRDIFESVLRDENYSPVTIQVYASAVCNPDATAHPQAVNLWKKLMEGIPLPEWDALNSPANRPTGLSYNVGEKRSPERFDKPVDDKTEDVVEIPVQGNSLTDLDWVRMILNKHEILTTVMNMPVDDDTKRKIISVLLEQ